MHSYSVARHAGSDSQRLNFNQPKSQPPTECSSGFRISGSAAFARRPERTFDSGSAVGAAELLATRKKVR
ncbi:hypothetical protein EYF80_038497 [Liparis tanakae]|uniref:Uncharacterized protein n=1 Tax=Liparis tanakae TaxID=230148 RepID=A0A4Z2GEL5_9TELE|nr:hypothetical protein EYF80_038497 [Liparis tanakae]